MAKFNFLRSPRTIKPAKLAEDATCTSDRDRHLVNSDHLVSQAGMQEESNTAHTPDSREAISIKVIKYEMKREKDKCKERRGVSIHWASE